MSAVKRTSLLAATALLGACAATLPPAPEHARAPASRERIPSELKACWAELSDGEGPAWPTTKGPTETKTFHGTVSSLVVRHPQGDVVIDVGNSEAFRKDWADYPFVLRKKMDLAPGRMKWVVKTHREALEKVGVDASQISKMRIILTHAHADHAGGVGDLPGVPVLTTKEEIDFVAATGGKPSLHVVPAHAKAMEGRLTALAFDSGPYEIYERSQDLFGDGSVVVVPLPGHTPGSLGVFVNLPDGRRLFHIGDTAMLAEAVTKSVPKGRLVKELDWDYDATNARLAEIHALAQKDPALIVMPAHDRNVWEHVFGKTAYGCIP